MHSFTLLTALTALLIAFPAFAFTDTAVLSWKINDPNASGSRIEVSKDGGAWTTAYTVNGKGNTSRTVLLSSGQKWCYRVRTILNNGAVTDPSNVTCDKVTHDLTP